jgi:SAM-dependent methyltransferase
MAFIDPIDVATIIKYHKDLLKVYSIEDTKTMGWSGNSQLERFQILAQIDDLNHKSILDIGCGNAKLYDYLIPLYPHIRYTGLDLVPEFLENATIRLANCKDVQFYQGNLMSEDLPLLDYYLVSGSLSYKNSNPIQIFISIQHLYNSCRLGLGFNLLSAVPSIGELVVAYNKEMIVEFCKLLSNKVILKEGYLANDYTIFMYH